MTTDNEARTALWTAAKHNPRLLVEEAARLVRALAACNKEDAAACGSELSEPGQDDEDRALWERARDDARVVALHAEKACAALARLLATTDKSDNDDGWWLAADEATKTDDTQRASTLAD